MIDLLDPALHASDEIVHVLDELRARAPIAWCAGRRGPGYWSVTGYPELVAIARDPATFSSFWGTRPEALRPAGARRPLHNLDPPAHAELRTRAMQACLGARLDVLAPQFEAIVADVLAGMLRDGGGDAALALAEPIGARCIAAWLGLAPSFVDPLRVRVGAVHAAGAALLDTSADDPLRATRVDAARDASTAIAALMQHALADAPDDTALGVLRAGAGAEALGLACLFVEAGLPTVIDALATSVHALAEHQLARVDARLVEELLRLGSPIAQFARRVTRDIEVGTTRLREGDQVVLWFVAANRDPRVFRDPTRLDAARAPNPHLAFGIGVHRCLGASLGRRILHSTLSAIALRRPVLAGAPVRRASSYLRGFAHLPVRFR